MELGQRARKLSLRKRSWALTSNDFVQIRQLRSLITVLFESKIWSRKLWVSSTKVAPLLILLTTSAMACKLRELLEFPEVMWNFWSLGFSNSTGFLQRLNSRVEASDCGLSTWFLYRHFAPLYFAPMKSLHSTQPRVPQLATKALDWLYVYHTTRSAHRFWRQFEPRSFC